MLEMPSGPFLPSLFNRIYVPICKEMILQKIITISFRKLSQNSESTERLTHTLFQEWVLQVQLSVMVTFSLRVLPIFTSITGLLMQAQDALPFLVYGYSQSSSCPGWKMPQEAGFKPRELSSTAYISHNPALLFFPLIQLLI